jgi:hypothetical protein
MQCNELESVLADGDLGPLPLEAREHLAGCSSCRNLLADFSAIVNTAKQIPAEVNPPERVWISLRAQLEAEGIIRDVDVAEAAPAIAWWQGFAQFFRPRVLAPAATALLVAAGCIYYVERPSENPNAPVATAVAQTSTVETAKSASAEVPAPALTSAPAAAHHDSPGVSAGTHVPPVPKPSTQKLRPSPSEDMFVGQAVSDSPGAVLNATESALPTQRLARNAMVDAALRENLRTLNEFIAECEARLKKNPQDNLTREYLNMAYQQKAELLSAMMDSGRSEN